MINYNNLSNYKIISNKLIGIYNLTHNKYYVTQEDRFSFSSGKVTDFQTVEFAKSFLDILKLKFPYIDFEIREIFIQSEMIPYAPSPSSVANELNKLLKSKFSIYDKSVKIANLIANYTPNSKYLLFLTGASRFKKIITEYFDTTVYKLSIDILCLYVNDYSKIITFKIVNGDKKMLMYIIDLETMQWMS